eukprot:bmy_20323T0
MIPDDPKAHAFEVSFADLHNHAATFHTFKLIMRTLGQTMPKQPPWNGYYLQQHAFQDQEEAGHNGSLYLTNGYLLHLFCLGFYQETQQLGIRDLRSAPSDLPNHDENDHKINQDSHDQRCRTSGHEC